MKDMVRERKQQIADLNAYMKVFGRLPAGYKRWVENELFKEETFLAFNNKTRYAHCAACDTEYEIPKKTSYKHDSVGECPVCGAKVRFVRESVGKYRETIKWALVIQRGNEDVLLRYIRNIKKYSEGYKTHEIEVQETLRTISGEKGNKEFQYCWMIGGWLPYRDSQWTFYNRPNIYDLPKDGVHVYGTKNISRTLSKTWAKYSGLHEFVEHKGNFHDRPYYTEWYLNDYRTRPQIEKLAKVGFLSLIDATHDWHFRDFKLHDGDTLREVLDINRHQLKLLHHAGDPTYQEYKLAKMMDNMPVEIFDYIRANGSLLSNRGDLFEMADSIGSLVGYFRKHNIQYADYRDYMRWLKGLDYPLDKYYRYPADFRSAHDRLHAEWQAELDRQEAERNSVFDAKMQKRLQDFKGYKADGLFVSMPSSVAELKAEGKTLHHCVGTYAERVANGDTSIYFIRKEEEPETPYFTLEIKNGTVIQCRGYSNCNANDAVNRFVNDFTLQLSA